ncbi:MAG: hypothetical protein A2Y91_02080 [Chloroflexi bacterium RBG_13_54_8]|nr:MAG: hypothetical protein A2Y91_02080 [Chloroflexi bacterium RBG_13_54_8]
MKNQMSKLIIDTSDLLSIPESMAELEVGYATLYRWIKQGRILAVRMSGRTLIPRSEVDRVKGSR